MRRPVPDRQPSREHRGLEEERLAGQSQTDRADVDTSPVVTEIRDHCREERCDVSGDGEDNEFTREGRPDVATPPHNVAGTAVCDEGIVIDLSAMRAVRVDPKGRGV